MEQNKNVDKELSPLKKELEKIFRDHRCLQTANPSPGANPWTTPVTPDVEFAGIKATHVFWRNPIDQTNADRNNDIWDAVRKILMEHIDDPFTCDPRTASREEFARRNINAVVLCEHHNWEDLCYTVELMGVVQGDTLIAPNGDRIKNYNWKQDRPKQGMPTYKDGLFESIKLENLGKIKLNSLDSFGFIYDKDNDNG